MKKLFMLALVGFIISGLSFAGSITVNSPNGSESWKRGFIKTIRWDGSGLTNSVKITLWKNDVLLGLIVKDKPASGRFGWRVGTYQGGVAEFGTDYKIKIREQGGVDYQTEDESNNSFGITDPNEHLRSVGQIPNAQKPADVNVSRKQEAVDLRGVAAMAIYDFTVENLSFRFIRNDIKNGGRVLVTIKNNGAAYSGDLKIRYSIDNETTNVITRRVNYRKGDSRSLTLAIISPEDCRCFGGNVSAKVNYNKEILETNYDNNYRMKNIYAFPGGDAKIERVVLTILNNNFTITDGCTIILPADLRGISERARLSVTIKNCGHSMIRSGVLKLQHRINYVRNTSRRAYDIVNYTKSNMDLRFEKTTSIVLRTSGIRWDGSSRTPNPLTERERTRNALVSERVTRTYPTVVSNDFTLSFNNGESGAVNNNNVIQFKIK